MRTLPSGTVTFLFTDIEGSTRLLRELGDAYPDALAMQRRLVRAAISAHSGVEVDTQGDAFFVAFARASDAVAAATDAQRALSTSPVRLRMAIHTGQPTVTEEGYVGFDVHRGARICAAGHGGQVLLSRTTRELIDPSVEVRDLGEHRLKDLAQPEWLFQVVAVGLKDEFPPLKTLSNTNLPAHATSLVGRDRELAELKRLLLTEDVRLVTVTGSGGTGKTRLAVELASQLVEHFRNGAFFVQLAPVTNPELVLPTIAHTLGALETTGDTLSEAVRRHVRGRSLLLVLDNFEHLLPAATDVATILTFEPQLKIVVTSRERLRISGEHERVLSPLPSNDAIALFEERARAADARFPPSDAHDVIAQICRRLDGVPLAIELAAARGKHLSPHALLARLERRLSVLTGGPRDVPERQRTLRATIDWSYELLPATEQRVFARLSVFAGGCTLDAATDVCDADADTIASLVDKSLLSREVDRYNMLDTVREYAHERLVIVEDEHHIAHRHTAYFVALAEHAEPLLHGPEQLTWLVRLEREHDNFRVVLSRLVELGDNESALRLGAALSTSFSVQGRIAEGRRWLELALSRPGGGAARAKALVSAALLALAQGEHQVTSANLEEAASLYQALGDELGLANVLGAMAYVAEDDDVAMSLVERALIIQRRLRDEAGMARSLNVLGQFAWGQAEVDTARSSYEAELRLERRLGNLRGIAAALNGLGHVARNYNDFRAARYHYEEALRIRRELGDRVGAAWLMYNLALVARNEADPRAARRLQQEALAISRDSGATALTATLLIFRGRLACDEGDYATARSLFEEAQALTYEARYGALTELGVVAHNEGKDEEAAAHQRESLSIAYKRRRKRALIIGLERLGCALASSDASYASRLIGAADAARETRHAPRAPIQQPAIDECLDIVRRVLGENAAAARIAEGRAMSLDDAVRYALGESGIAAVSG